MKVGLVGQVGKVGVNVGVVNVGKVENQFEVDKVGRIVVINWLFTIPDTRPFEQTRLNGSEVKFFSQHI